MCENTDSRCTTTATVRGTRLAGGPSRFLCLSFFAAAKKVSAAPHRGNANKPISNQGKANAVGTQTNKRRAGNQIKQSPTPQAYRRTKRRAGQNHHFPSDNPRSSAATPAGNSTLTPRSTIVRPSACKVLNRLCSRHCSPICPIRTIGNPNEPEIST